MSHLLTTNFNFARTALLEHYQHIDVVTGTKERGDFVSCPADDQLVVNMVR